jgi:hypothetical protein
MYCITRPSEKDSQKQIIDFIKQIRREKYYRREILPERKAEIETELV